MHIHKVLFLYYMEVKGKIDTYNMEERTSLIEAARGVMDHAGISTFLSDILSCVDELIKNSVKANYKFILIREYIMDKICEDFPQLPKEEQLDLFREMAFTRISFDTMAVEFMQGSDISSAVRQVLNEEGRYMRILNRAYRENRDLTDEEQEELKQLEGFHSIRKKLKEHNINIFYKVQVIEDFLYFEITNTAPMLTMDLRRIHDKRSEFKQYHSEGREQDFFINNIDTSDSGHGLGYAKIDSFLYHLGLEPEESAAIISSIDTTVMLILPLKHLQVDDTH